MQKVYQTQNLLKKRVNEWVRSVFHNAGDVSTYLMQNALQIDSVRFSILNNGWEKESVVWMWRIVDENDAIFFEVEKMRDVSICADQNRCRCQVGLQSINFNGSAHGCNSVATQFQRSIFHFKTSCIYMFITWANISHSVTFISYRWCS